MIPRQPCLAIACVTLLLAPAVSPASVAYVNAIAPAGGNGTSWATAFRYLDDALTAARVANSGITEIWVAEGTYRPGTGVPDQAATLQLVSGVSLYGGFAGTESQRDQRDPIQHVTTLSGQVGTLSDNYATVTVPYNATSILIDGFYFTRGVRQVSAESSATLTVRRCWFRNFSYAGLYLGLSDSTIENCDFSQGSLGGMGHAYINGGTTTIRGCSFHDAEIRGLLLSSAAARILASEFRSLRVTSSAGGIDASNSEVLVSSCVFNSNLGSLGGAIYASSGSLLLSNSTLCLNTATSITDTAVSADSALVRNCIVWGSSSRSSNHFYSSRNGIRVRFSLVRNGWPGEGNINADPGFIDADGMDNIPGTADDDFRLSLTSPAIDAGDNAAADYAGPQTDYAGNPRRVDVLTVTDSGRGIKPLVDMGAFERQAEPGIVTTRDLITVNEGSSASFGVSLSTDPGGPVSLSIADPTGDSDLTLSSSATLTFDSTNYMIPQAVVIAAAEDADGINGSATLTLTAPSLPAHVVNLREIDNDIPSNAIFVRAGAPAGGDGSSWASAFNDLQAALAVAATRTPVEVWVAGGVYRPAAPGGSRSASFVLKSGIQIYGGFVGSESSRLQRDPELNSTVLSGDLNGDDATQPSRSDNSTTIVTSTSADRTALLDGFVIRDGTSRGLYVTGGSPIIRRCRFVRNPVRCSGELLGVNCAFADAGVTIESQGISIFHNCTFTQQPFSTEGLYTELVNCTSTGRITNTGILAMANSIVWTSATTESGNLRSLGLALIDYSTIRDLISPWGQGNHATDPIFVDPAGADGVGGTEDDVLALQHGSPAADAGSNNLIPADIADIDEDGDTSEPLPLDILGGPRRLDDPLSPDIGQGTAPVVAMGAYEKAPTYFIAPSTLTMNEGQDVSFTVSLSDDPGGSIEVHVARREGSADVSVVEGGTLTFNSTNFNVPQTVTLRANPDPGFVDDTLLLNVSAQGIASQSVSLTVTDSQAAPVIIYVNQAATGLNTGLSWQDAFTSVVIANAAAHQKPAVREVWIAQGTYPCGFTVSRGIEFYGGFLGNETQRDQRNAAAHSTSLRASIDGYALIYLSNSMVPLVLDGLSITGVRGLGNTGSAFIPVLGKVIVRDCTFTDNRLDRIPAGSNDIGVAVGTSAEVLFESCRFVDNAILEGYRGSAVLVGGGSARFVNCLFAGTKGIPSGITPAVPTHPRALYHVAGMLELVNCTFAYNGSASSGGGVYVKSYGSGYTPVCNITNCVFWGNQDSTGFTESAQVAVVGPNATLTVNRSLIQGLTGALGGVGNIGGNPLFANPLGADGIAGTLDDDLRLLAGSPAIDAGRNAAVPAGVLTDLAGLPRFVDDPATSDTGEGPPPIVDMGAYEFAPADTAAPVLQQIASRRTHGPLGPLDLPLWTPNSHGVECRNGGIQLLVLEFDEPIQPAGAGDPVVTIDGAPVANVTIDGSRLLVTPTSPPGMCAQLAVSGVADGLGNTLPAPVQRTLHSQFGDVDSDGQVSIGDAVIIRSMIQQTTAAQSPQYDVNCSGQINLGDAIAIKAYVGQRATNCPE